MSESFRAAMEGVLLVLILFAFVGALLYLVSDAAEMAQDREEQCVLTLDKAGVEPQVIWEVCR